MRRSVVSSSGNFLIRPVRTAASRSLAPGLCGSASPIWDRFRRPTLVGLLRHSKRFFGPLGRSGNAAIATIRRRAATARAMPDRSCRTAPIASPSAANKTLDVALLPGPDLDHQMAAGASRRARVGGDRPIGRKAVGAAVERMARIVVAHLGGERRNLARRDVGRVRHHEIERAGEPAAVIAHEKLRAIGKAEPLALRARDVERIAAMSVPTPRAFGSSDSSASRIAPEPVPRSAMRNGRVRSAPIKRRARARPPSRFPAAAPARRA